MFTGLVEGMGVVASIVRNGPGVDLSITPPACMVEGYDSVRIGDSIAINGCCLTVVEHSQQCWLFQAGTETLSRTNLGRLQSGSSVNLERSLKMSDRLGGHFVQGHVDGVGTVAAIDKEGDWITMWFQVPERLTRQMVEKGSVCVDGVSLTLVHVEQDRFSIALIPHTLEVTTLGQRALSDVVNIETDIIGKYLEKMVSAGSKM